MSKSTRRLGRGLDSLVSHLRVDDDQELSPAGRARDPETNGSSPPGASSADTGAMMVSVESLEPNPLQPRTITDNSKILSLAESIRRAGLLQPIVVRARGGKNQIIAGERRWRAAKHIGLQRVPVIVREATDEQMLELALIENIQREDLNAIDRARAYRQFCTRFSVKPEEVATRLGEDRTTVVNYLRLLDLSEPIQRLVQSGAIGMGHARCLLGISDEARRMDLAESVVQSQLSVRALEEIIRREKKRERSTEDLAVVELRSAHVRDVQRRFEEAVKTKVTIRPGKRKGTGRIVIEYYSLDDFERIASLLNVPAE